MPGNGSWNSGRRFERLDLGDAVADQAKNLLATMRGVA
jgi:hypothetical protein